VSPDDAVLYWSTEPHENSDPGASRSYTTSTPLVRAGLSDPSCIHSVDGCFKRMHRSTGCAFILGVFVGRRAYPNAYRESRTIPH